MSGHFRTEEHYNEGAFYKCRRRRRRHFTLIWWPASQCMPAGVQSCKLACHTVESMPGCTVAFGCKPHLVPDRRTVVPGMTGVVVSPRLRGARAQEAPREGAEC